MASLKDYLQLHFIVLIWGFTAILGLLISVPPVEIVFYRTLIAAIALAIFLSWKGESLKLRRRDWWKIPLTGLLIGAHWILFFLSARVANASVSLAGMATLALWTSILEPLMTKKKFRLFEILLGISVLSGLYVIFRFEFEYALGLFLAILSAFLAAVFSIINSQLTLRYNHYHITLLEMGGACVSIALFFPVYAKYFSEAGHLQLVLEPMDILYLLILAGVCTVYAYSKGVELMQRISAFGLNLTIHLEPVYGIILAVIFFNEHENLSPGFYVGTLIILISVLSYPVVNHFVLKKSMEPDLLR